MKSVLILSLLLLIKACWISAEVCKKYVCSKLEEENCIFNNEAEGIVELQKCKDELQFCPFMSSQEEVKCTSREGFHPRSFPGGVCEDDSGCIAGSCIEGVCSSKQLGEQCKDNTECAYGLTCKKSGDLLICQTQLEEGEACENDFECKNTHGCSLGKCVPYLSLPVGASIDQNPRNALPVCKSGLYYKGKCSLLTNVGNNPIECSNDNPCKYKLDDDSQVEVPEFCTCGKNPLGVKICKLGNDNSEWTEFLNTLKTLLENTDNCNTLERGVCMSHLRQSGREIQEYIAARTKVLRYHELAGADDCVVNIFFPEIAKSQRSSMKINFINKDNQ